MNAPDAAPQSYVASNVEVSSPTGLSFPINVTSATQGTFTGNLRIVGFAADNGALVAAGIVSGTRTDANGVSTAVLRMVSLPVIATHPMSRASGAAPPAVSCGILHLELGPLDLDLLGLVIHLDKVVLDITAVPGAGNLLGNLLCGIAGLLDGGGNLRAIASALTDLLGLLG